MNVVCYSESLAAIKES